MASDAGSSGLGPNNNPRGGDGNARLRKRRVRDVFDRYGAEEPIPYFHQDVNVDVRQLSSDPTKGTLQHIEQDRVAFQYRNSGPSFLETPRDHVNFYARDGDKPVFSNAYYMKCVGDDASLGAMMNTIKQLHQLHNAPIVNVHVEFQTQRTVEQHRSYSKQQSRAGQTQPPPTPAPPMPAPPTPADARPVLRPRLRASDKGRARRAQPGGSAVQGSGSATQGAAVPAPSSGSSRAPTSQSAGDRAGRDRTDVEAASSGSASKTTAVKCASCGGDDHEAAACVKPTGNYGSLRGCTVCNSRTHHLDDCGLMRFDLSDADDVNMLLHTVLHQRANKPQTRSTKWPFYDVLSFAVALQIITNLSTVYSWPWSNEFAKKIFKARSGDPILGGKVHPRDFIHGKHTDADLPTDPLFHGKTVLEVINMDDKLLASDRFINAANKHTATVLAEKNMHDIVHRHLTSLDAYEIIQLDEGDPTSRFRKKERRLKSRSEIAESLRGFKFEESTGFDQVQKGPLVLNTGAFQQVGVILEDEDTVAWYSRIKQAGDLPQFRALGQEKQIQDNVVRFYIDPESLDREDPVFKHLSELHGGGSSLSNDLDEIIREYAGELWQEEISGNVPGDSAESMGNDPTQDQGDDIELEGFMDEAFSGRRNVADENVRPLDKDPGDLEMADA